MAELKAIPRMLLNCAYAKDCPGLRDAGIVVAKVGNFHQPIQDEPLALIPSIVLQARVFMGCMPCEDFALSHEAKSVKGINQPR